MNHNAKFGPLVPSNLRIPDRETLLNNLGKLQEEFVRLHAVYRRTLSRELAQQIRAVQLGVENILHDIRQHYPRDYGRRADLAAVLTFDPTKERGTSNE